MNETDANPADIEVRYSLTIETYLRAIADWVLDDKFIPHARKYRTALLMRWFWWILIGSFGVYWFLRANNPPDLIEDIRMLCAGLGLIVFAGVAIPKLSLTRTRKAMTKHTVMEYRKSVAPHLFSPTVLRLDAHGIETTDSLRTTRIAWAGVVRATRTRSALFIETADDNGPIVPLEDLEDGTIAAIEDMIASRAGGADAEEKTLVRVLQDRDLLCPKCKYQCRGVAAARCPECGRPIVKEDFIMTDAAAQIVIREHLGV